MNYNEANNRRHQAVSQGPNQKGYTSQQPTQQQNRFQGQAVKQQAAKYNPNYNTNQ